MSAYTILAETEFRAATLERVRGYLEAEKSVEENITLITQEKARAECEAAMIKVAMAMDRDMLFNSLAWNYGHEIYLGEERLFVRSLVEVCADMFEGWTYEQCAKAIGREYDDGRLGVNL